MSKNHRLSVVLPGILLRFCLFFGFTILAMVIVIGNRQNFKHILQENDVYNRWITAVIDTGQKESDRDPSDIPFDNPEVQKIIRNSFSEQTIRTDTEEIIDSVYEWLEGKTLSPDFRINLSDNKQALATGLSDYAVKRLESLPTCRSMPDVTNIYRVDCLPPYVDPGVQKKLVYDSIINDQSILKENEVTFSSLISNPQNADHDFTKAPSYYKWLKLAPWVLLAISIFLMGYIIMRHKTRRQGIKQISTALMTTGVALIITPIMASLITPSLSRSVQANFSDGSVAVASIVSDISLSIFRDLNQLLIIIATIVFVMGLIIRLTLNFYRPKN